MSKEIAKVMSSCGRWVLIVADIPIAMEGDKCRAPLPEEVMPPIPSRELAHASFGGKPVKDMPIEIIRWFRGEKWNKKMMEYVAARINEAAQQ